MERDLEKTKMKTEVKIILLNGVGSAGKTSIVKALQSILEDPYLHLSVDLEGNLSS